MTLTLEVPDDLAAQLEASWHDLSKEALEALAVEAYVRGDVTSEEVQRLLGLSKRDTEVLLTNRQESSTGNAVDSPVGVRTLSGTGSKSNLSPIQRRAFERMRKGWDLGGPPYPTREELYDREALSRR